MQIGTDLMRFVPTSNFYWINIQSTDNVKLYRVTVISSKRHKVHKVLPQASEVPKSRKIRHSSQICTIL